MIGFILSCATTIRTYEHPDGTQHRKSRAMAIVAASASMATLFICLSTATIAMEMEPPFLWTCVIVALVGASTLFRGALLRGRDYVCSGAGAGCIIALLISLFASDGIPGLTHR
jgi:hypothetical protein